MKKIIIGLLLLLSCFLVAGCGKNESIVEERKLVGGWDIDIPINQLELPTKVKEVFENRSSNYTKMKLTPVSLLAESDSNYMYLCKGETDSSIKWVIVTINNSEITNIKYFNLNEYVNNEENNCSSDNLGNWIINNKLSSSNLNKDIQQAFNKAVKDSDLTYKPISLLGEQIVAGTNYAILTLVENKKGVYSINVLNIFAGLDGNSSLISSACIPLNEYSK